MNHACILVQFNTLFGTGTVGPSTM